MVSNKSLYKKSLENPIHSTHEYLRNQEFNIIIKAVVHS